jgi:hypothetical protein
MFFNRLEWFLRQPQNDSRSSFFDVTIGPTSCLRFNVSSSGRSFRFCEVDDGQVDTPQAIAIMKWCSAPILALCPPRIACARNLVSRRSLLRVVGCWRRVAHVLGAFSNVQLTTHVDQRSEQPLIVPKRLHQPQKRPLVAIRQDRGLLQCFRFGETRRDPTFDRLVPFTLGRAHAFQMSPIIPGLPARLLLPSPAPEWPAISDEARRRTPFAGRAVLGVHRAAQGSFQPPEPFAVVSDMAGTMTIVLAIVTSGEIAN